MEEIIADALRNEWNFEENLVSEILGFTFDMSSKSRLSFQVCWVYFCWRSIQKL